MGKLMEFYSTDSKQRAITKLKKLFNKVIISNVYKTEDWIYTIERLTKDMFYINSVEAQADMDGYLDYMIKKLDKTLEDVIEDIKNIDSSAEPTLTEEKQEQIDDLQNNIS